MPEPYLADGTLLAEKEWKAFLDAIDDTLLQDDKAVIINKLQKLLESAVKKRLPSATAKIGVLFSGGIDSTLIAFVLKDLDVDFTCIGVGFQDGNAKTPEDIVEGEKVAKQLGFPYERIIFNMEKIEELFRKTATILGKPLVNVINIGVGSVVVAGIEKGKELGITHFFGGLGSEEIFAGYDRHEKALEAGGNEALHKECLAGLATMYQRDLRRDTTIAKHFGITLATPFLDDELITFSLRIPPQFKITDATFSGRGRGDVPDKRRFKKVILREAAEAMDLPQDIAWRPKRAAQYGARTNNALTKLRKQAGCRDKEEYLARLGVQE